MGNSQRNRREFLHRSVVVSTFVLAGCAEPRRSGDGPVAGGLSPTGRSSRPGPPGYLGMIDLKNPSWLSRRIPEEPAGVKLGRGRNARQYADLAGLLPEGPVDLDQVEKLVHSNAQFYIRTETPDLLDVSKVDRIGYDGLVAKPGALPVREIFAMERDIGVAMLECAGNDRFSRFRLMSAAHWSGVRCADLFERIALRAPATHVHVTGHDRRRINEPPALFAVRSDPGASWIFSFDQLARQGAFFATRMNGERLTPDHGYPVRLVVPGWYGCASIKWVRRLTFLKPDEKTRATSQMVEFADRTHQQGAPSYYLSYVPPEVDVAAAPIRVEKWRDAAGALSYRIIGLLWGGIEVNDPDLRITIRDRRGGRPAVDRAPVERAKRKNPLSWQLWSYRWRPGGPGRWKVDLSVNSASVKTRRLDVHHYRQVIEV